HRAAARVMSQRDTAGIWYRPCPNGTMPVLRDDPGLAGVEERGEVALPLLLLGDLQLLRHQVVVNRALDVAEEADRRAAVRLLRHPRQRKRERRGLVARRMHEHAGVIRRARLDRAV